MFHRCILSIAFLLGAAPLLISCATIQDDSKAKACVWQLDGQPNEDCHRKRMHQILSNPTMRGFEKQHSRAKPEFSYSFKKSNTQPDHEGTQNTN